MAETCETQNNSLNGGVAKRHAWQGPSKPSQMFATPNLKKIDIL